jgi:hypothetical protein
MPGFCCVFVLQQLASISTVVAVQISTAAVCKVSTAQLPAIATSVEVPPPH